MDKKKIISAYKKKIIELEEHNKAYYEKSKPKISDDKYDILKKEILELEKNYNYLNDPKSPSNKVGYKPSKNFKKIKHKVPMLSLSNAFDEKDLEKD